MTRTCPVGVYLAVKLSVGAALVLLERAEAGPVNEAEFVACVRDSLPYAWAVISEVAGELTPRWGRVRGPR